MQVNDNNKNAFDDKFFDQAWNNMRETLDKEMPVKKKRRRFLPWFFLMAGSFIGIMVWYGITLSGEDVSNKEVTQNLNSTDINILSEPLEKVNIEKNENDNIKIANIILPKKETKVLKKKLTPSTDVVISPKVTPSHFVNKKIIVDANQKTKAQIINRVDELVSIVPVLEKNNQQTELEIKRKYLADGTGNLCPPKRIIEFGASLGAIYSLSSSSKIGFTTV